MRKKRMLLGLLGYPGTMGSGSTAASTAGQAIGLLLALTKAT